MINPMGKEQLRAAKWDEIESLTTHSTAAGIGIGSGIVTLNMRHKHMDRSGRNGRTRITNALRVTSS